MLNVKRRMMSTNNYQGLVREELLKYGVATNMGLNEVIKERIANGEAIFHMAFGQSPFPVYEQAIEKLKDHAGENDYLPVAGNACLLLLLDAKPRRC